MKFRYITAAAALLVVSVAALPTPQVDNHGLIPDTDEFGNDAAVEALEARAVTNAEDFVDDETIEVVEVVDARTVDTDEAADDETIGVVEVVEARTVADIEEGANDDIEVVEARTAEITDAVNDDTAEIEPVETLEARAVDTTEAVDDDAAEVVEVIDARTVEATEAVDDDTAEVEPVETVEARTVTDTEVVDDDETAEPLEARDVTDTDEAVDDDATIETIEARTVSVSEAAANFNFTSDFDFALDRLLAAIEEIPDDILQKGDEALHQWLVEHGHRAGNEKLKRDDSSEAESLSLLKRGELAARASLWKIAKCVAAIVQLLGTTAIPAAKLLRIKKYIKALGGTKEAVKLLLGATTQAERLKVGGQALVALAAELLGISTVKNNCF